ncbi:MAG: flavodoxin family protein [Candidatus Geothermincolia bacterium]
MKGLVVYHTKFGNCRKIAESLARGLEEAGLDVTLINTTTRKIAPEYDFLAAGAGTRMGRLTGEMKRFLGREIKGDSWAGMRFLAFGTGTRPEGDGSKYDDWSVRGAVRIYEALEEKGLKPVAGAAKFYVAELKGPLDEGEEERARELGLETGKALMQPVG